MNLVDVALPVPVLQLFTYDVPEHLRPHIRRGMRVIVPFGKKILTGIALRFPETTPLTSLKSILDLPDLEPAATEEFLRFTEWIAEYYFAPPGETLRAALPHAFTVSSKGVVRLTEQGLASGAQEHRGKKSPKRTSILKTLHREGTQTIAQLASAVHSRSIYAILNALKQDGLIAIDEETIDTATRPKFERTIACTTKGLAILQAGDEPPAEPKLTAKQFALLKELGEGVWTVAELLKEARSSTAIMNALSAKGLAVFGTREVERSAFDSPAAPLTALTLTTAQAGALSAIEQALDAGTFKTFLIHGITGSGKTQVYIEAIRKVLALGKTAIVLVPEISLTPQMVSRFRAHFGDSVAVLHSRMSDGERYDSWRSIRRGEKTIVIGPRSALFAPLANIGLVVVDEEHEGSYKQYDSTPRYHARDAAIVRAMFNQAVAVLGSATPSMESYYNALHGKYALLTLPERIDTARLPEITIVNILGEHQRIFAEIKKEVKEKGIPFPSSLPRPSISRLMREHLAQRIERKEGSIILQNRRGYAHMWICSECGHVEQCENCAVSLTYHLTRKHLRCHYCGFTKTPPNVCPSCEGFEIQFSSYGTQQIQQELQSLFPESVILRMDLDTTRRRGSFDKILEQFGEGKADILLGTQMVAKGLDFPRVTLVGVVSADTQLLLPDFRASERTFQLLTQVAGRAGRSQLAGEVIIQTNRPDHYAIKHATTHNFEGFYNEEIAYRHELHYPPFSRLVLIECTGEDEGKLRHLTRDLATALRQRHDPAVVQILGPSEAAIPKINKKFRRQLVLKSLKAVDPSGDKLRHMLHRVRKEFLDLLPSSPRLFTVTIDIDPQGMI